MNTLATHPAQALPTSDAQPRAERGQPGARSESQVGAFLLGSIAVHVCLLAFFSSMPTAAHAANSLDEDIEVSMVPDAPTITPPSVTEPDTALPQGKIEAPLASPAPVESVVREVAAEQPSDAPEILAVDNPYASADAAVFTSGSAERPAPTPTKTVSGPSIGVETGSQSAAPERSLELKAWYNSVRSQLSQTGNQAYPRRALKLGQEGTASVSVRIDESGRLTDVRIAKSSGAIILDESALERIKSAVRVGPPPKGAGAISVIVPITFRIP